MSANEELAQELHKLVIEKSKVYASFKDKIWDKALAEMGSLSSHNHGVKYLLQVIDFSTKFAWVKPFKDKKAKTVLHGFVKIVNESNRKSNKYGLIKS